MANNEQNSVRVNIRDINPLEHITSDLANSRVNFEAIMNGLVNWNTTDQQKVTVRLTTDNYPYFVDYTFPSRSAFIAEGTKLADEGIPVGSFDYGHMIDMVATTSDEVTIRMTVADGNRGMWTLYEDAIVAEEATLVASSTYRKGQFLRTPSGANGTMAVCVATCNIAVGDTLDSGNTRAVVTPWRIADFEQYGEYPGTVALRMSTDSGPLTIMGAYVLRGTSTQDRPGLAKSHWEQVAESFAIKKAGTFFETGMLYVYSTQSDFSDAALYMYTGTPVAKPADNSITPVDSQGHLNENWYGPLILVPVTDVSTSTVVHHVPTTDINGFIMRVKTADTTMVNATANLAVLEGTAEPNKGLKVFRTSNYVSWPDNESKIWVPGTDYSSSDSYTARMVFHHASEDVKMCNIVNYDGPDLDRGLAIYLPVKDRIVGDSGEDAYVEAKDGAVFEFLFRIWPQASYNGASTADLIINKAQVYVYSVQRSDELDSATVLAKFSMARLTNFYLWAENVAVPNRPVFYKAKFIYSRDAGEWKTYDYYQVPDHVFLSPKGFVDPSIRNDSEGDSYGSDSGFSGVQTAGFPLMQDPFGGLDMGAVRMNRIEPNA